MTEIWNPATESAWARLVSICRNRVDVGPPHYAEPGQEDRLVLDMAARRLELEALLRETVKERDEYLASDSLLRETAEWAEGHAHVCHCNGAQRLREIHRELQKANRANTGK